MSFIKLLSSPQGQQLLNQMTTKLGISSEQAQQAAIQLLPAIQQGLTQKMKADPASLADLLQKESGALLQSADDQQDNPDNISEVGNNLLGQIFGSKDVSRQIASRASENTGLDVGTLKSMLPMLASVAGGKLLAQGQQQQSSGLGSLIGSFLNKGGASKGGLNLAAMANMLDSDNDGSIADDLMQIASKFMKK